MIQSLDDLIPVCGHLRYWTMIGLLDWISDERHAPALKVTTASAA